MTYPLFNIFNYILSVIISFFTAWRLQSYYKKSLLQLARHFRDMALSNGIGTIIYALTFVLFIGNPFALGIGSIIGGMFLLAAHIYGVVIFFYLTFPHISSKKIIIAGMILVVLVTISHIKFLPYPEINEKGFVNFNFSPFSRAIFILFSTAGLLPLSIAFIREAIREKHLRTRSGFLAFSFLFLVIANGLQSIVGPQLYIYAYLLIPTIAYIVIFIAVILRVKASSVDTKTL